MSTSVPTQETKTLPKLELLKLMAVSREGDRREGILIRQSKGHFHISGMGHEAVSALAYALRDDDYLFPHYRDRALMLARGLSAYDLALAFFGKSESSSGGRQMPSHFSDRSRNVWSLPSPVGANQLPAAGAAWAMKMDGKDSVVVTSIGDASSRQGEFYEAVSFAIEKRLPVIFLVQDNQYGISTHTTEMNPFRLGVFGDSFVTKVDGRSVDSVLEAGSKAVAKARRGDGPTVLWIDVDRLNPHSSSDDHTKYRSPDDIEQMWKRCPIQRLADELIASGDLTSDSWEEMQADVQREVDDLYQRAAKATDPDPARLMEHLYGAPETAETPPIEAGGRMTMVQAINRTLLKAMQTNEKVVIFGEDVEDPKGGVFGFTKGCSESHPNRVFNSPLAEATIAGVGCGMASYGWLPVFEMQFTDFIPPAFNQLITNLATLRWRTAGDWTCPMVIYCPYGAYLPGGSMWHSQSNDGLWAKLHGIRVAVPSTPEDAAGLMWTAIHGEDPAMIFCAKHIFRKPMQVPDTLDPVGWGKARKLREGKDVTIVTWGNCIELAEEAAERLAGEADIEILDLRTLVPCDWEAIETSLAKTGRLVVVNEDSRTCCFGATILTEMTSDPSRWDHFLSPPQLVAREDVHIGFNPILEYASLPDVDKVIQAVRLTME